MRGSVAVLAASCWLVLSTAAAVASPAVTPPFEITKFHVDVEVSADGSYVESREEGYRILNAQGVDALHEKKLAYTSGFETLDVMAAYTLKADGTRIDVPKQSYLSGYGLTSQPGFQDAHVMSLFFPNAEIGDQVVLVTVHRQVQPWFPGFFDVGQEFSRAYVTRDVRFSVTAPESMNIKVDASGMDGGAEQREGGKKRWTWSFHNDAPVTLEGDAVAETDFSPHLRLTSFKDYGDVAKAYRDRANSRAEVTPEIQALADRLTAATSDKRQQARLLYDWVSSHISYVQIVLGAGGFVPHEAKDVLANKFGDCKDHVVLLEALLKAKNIDSTAVLINAGANSFKLPTAASPHAFDHAITYLPEYKLYLDSTAQLAPFGVLPFQDTGKPVLHASTGEVQTTPMPTSANSSVRVTTEVELKSDGSAEGTSRIASTGATGIDMRGFMQQVLAGKEGEFLRSWMGPGVEGEVDRGDPRGLAEPYTFGVSYRMPNAVVLPGPAALPYDISFKPFYFTSLIAGSLPSARSNDYVCYSMDAEESIRIKLPAGVRLLSIPDGQTLDADGVHLTTEYERTDARTLRETFALKLDHPKASCTPEYYARVHTTLARMAQALRQQVIYKVSEKPEKVSENTKWK